MKLKGMQNLDKIEYNRFKNCNDFVSRLFKAQCSRVLNWAEELRETRNI